MLFDVYYPFVDKEGKVKPGIKPTPTHFEHLLMLVDNDLRYKAAFDEVRAGDKNAKLKLPAVCWMGICQGKTRTNDCMKPTGWVMIDIDHVEDPRAAYKKIAGDIGADLMKNICLCAHITPSGHGLRFVLRGYGDLKTIAENIERYDAEYHFSEYGDLDKACKDFSRLSFLCPSSENLYWGMLLEKGDYPVTGLVAPASGTSEHFREATEMIAEDFSDDEKKKYEEMDWRGFKVKTIMDKFVETYGEPTTGEIHNYHNEMIKYFRSLCSNNKRCLLYLISTYYAFGHSRDEIWSSIKSICKVNTLSSLPKEFYFFLKDNGFYVSRKEAKDEFKEAMMSDISDTIPAPPYLPPVIRDLVSGAPKDFVIPAINALMPILGTLTSYVGAVYPYDNRVHTTSFFSVIYAPPGTGKGFVERFIDLLFEDIKLRDFIQSQRENIYLRVMQRKGANDKAPEAPHTSMRIIPPKNSEAEFLQKQSDNKGYHMFTFAAEMDSWAKGSKAAGGNKDDMIRIAWDNGEYGQQFKSVNTFKGTVRLYWNVLITGTLLQLEAYFKNVENGLVTRCCFSPIENQEFTTAPVWKPLTEEQMKRVKSFMQRCDENTYEEPCDITPDDLAGIKDDDFDNEVKWRFQFKERQMVDCSWIMPTIDKFHADMVEQAAKDLDRARDVFRRRVGVRGFRLALLCSQLFAKFTKKDQEKCAKFIDWWMRYGDMRTTLDLWGKRYNEQAETDVRTPSKSVWDVLKDEFNANDVYVACLKVGYKSPVRSIVHQWKKLGLIEKLSKNSYRKIKNNKEAK